MNVSFMPGSVLPLETSCPSFCLLNSCPVQSSCACRRSWGNTSQTVWRRFTNCCHCLSRPEMSSRVSHKAPLLTPRATRLLASIPSSRKRHVLLSSYAFCLFSPLGRNLPCINLATVHQIRVHQVLLVKTSKPSLNL
jgi:hypothetical protein